MPETLPKTRRQPLHPRVLWANYSQVLRTSDFLVLSAIPTLNFAAIFIYVAAAPTYLGRSFGLSTYGFAWFFVPLISGIMTGVVFLGQLAGRLSPNRTIRIGYACMSRAHFSISWLLHSLRRMCLGTYCHYFVFTMGTSFVIPSVTLLPLGLFPAMRGLASSLAGFVQFAFSGFNAGTIAPFLAHSLAHSLASLASVGGGRNLHRYGGRKLHTPTGCRLLEGSWSRRCMGGSNECCYVTIWSAV